MSFGVLSFPEIPSFVCSGPLSATCYAIDIRAGGNFLKTSHVEGKAQKHPLEIAGKRSDVHSFSFPANHPKEKGTFPFIAALHVSGREDKTQGGAARYM